MGQLRHIGRRHIHLDVTDSTNARAAEFANDPAAVGTVVTADLQSRGRGQHGRVWQSPPGVSVLLSTLLFPPAEFRRPAVLTAFAAIAVSETVLQATGRPAAIKWPNDVLIDGKKVSGILIECGVAPIPLGREPQASTPRAIIGIGLNVNQTADDLARAGLPDATSLLVAGGRPFNVQEITRLLIETLDTEYGQMLDGEIKALESRWRQRVGLLNQPVVAELMDASEVRGRLTELGFGGLTLTQADGTSRRVWPEEVRHLRSDERERRH
jgi:BirA family transcriptional regulator, biotin operon repressor / biotin---[acetyl-CoA-carboxylase] ligase